jgi:hypothetical protein
MSKSNATGREKTLRTIRSTFSFSLYVGMMTRASDTAILEEERIYFENQQFTCVAA